MPVQIFTMANSGNLRHSDVHLLYPRCWFLHLFRCARLFAFGMRCWEQDGPLACPNIATWHDDF
jgi:hypothetical protein